jgi:hypothetical protein
VARPALARAGFDAVSAETVTVTWRVPTAELLFDAHVRAGVLVSAVPREQPPARLAAIRDAVVGGVRRHAAGDAFALPIVARVIAARAA